MTKNYKLLLASKSPRRRELLKMLGLPFETLEGRDIDETYPADLPAEQVPLYLSKLKATTYAPHLAADELLITADTVVINRGQVVGKPHDLEHARRMLRSLAGHAHTVITGVTLTARAKSVSFDVHTTVHFDELTDAEIDYYVDTYRPLDKAGAYGIQEWIGAAAVSGIDGSFYNVMGLPVHQLYLHLRDF